MRTKKELIDYWQEETGIKFGTQREDALEKFREYRGTKRTCQRCEGERHAGDCSVHIICEEADNVGDVVERNDYGTRVIEAYEPKTNRTQIFESRKGNALRLTCQGEKGVS